MSRIEDLIRDSLHDRAQDVEASPALWQEVQRRADRRRRLTVVTWSLAAATAAVVAVVALPTLVGLFTPPQTPEIVPLEEAPVGPGTSLPTHAVTTDGATLFLHDLATGDITELGGPQGREVVEIAVRPGSTPDDLVVAAATVAGDGTTPMFQVFAFTPEGAAQLDVPALAGDGAPSLAWSADGRWLAWLDSGAADADGNVVAYAPYVDGEIGFVQDLAVIDGDVRLTGWTGPTWALTDGSRLWYLREANLHQLPLTLHEDGFETGEPVREDLGDVLDFSALDATGEGAHYLMTSGPEGPLLYLTRGGNGLVPLDVPAEVLAADAASLRLAGHLDAVGVTNGQQAWLVTHRGGEDVQVAALEGTVRAIDLFGTSTVRPYPDPETDPDARGEAERERDAAIDGARDAEAGVRLGGPVLIADGRNLDVMDADGRRTVYTFPEEGHSAFVSLAVRPGSTVDDLTAVALTTAEGMYDLRTIRLVDGQATQEVFPEAYRPGAASAAGLQDVAGPVWAPDGTSLAWIEHSGQQQTLRTVGWDDGPGTGSPATDNAAFDLGANVPPLIPQQWEQVSAAQFEIWATNPDSNQGWYAIVLERQADGAWAIPAGQSPVEIRSAPGSPGDPVAAVAGVPGTGDMTWMVRNTFDGAVLVSDPYGDAVVHDLPDEVQWDDGLPHFQLATLAGGVLVQGQGAAAWLAPGEEPVVIARSGHAVPIR